MPKPATPEYRTTNWSAYNAALRKRGSLEVWFDPGMEWHSRHSRRPGRPPVFSDGAIEFCLTLKVLFGLALRQTTGLAASLLKLADLDWPVPDYTTLCRRQKTLSVSLGGRPSSDGLHLLVDSTGIKMMGEGEWKTRKHGASYRRQWRQPSDSGHSATGRWLPAGVLDDARLPWPGDSDELQDQHRGGHIEEPHAATSQMNGTRCTWCVPKCG